jgi:protein O-GlcNAc transferase
MIAGALNVTVPQDFWAPVRESLWRNILAPGFISGTIHNFSTLPLVTYVSRQGAGRRLVTADHDALVVALKSLEAEGICEVQVAALERMGVREQIELVSRSTVSYSNHYPILLIGNLSECATAADTGWRSRQRAYCACFIPRLDSAGPNV